MATSIIGPHTWSGQRDAEGYLTYKVKFHIKGLTTDGPDTVFNTPGLFLPGAPWVLDGDINADVWCRPEATATPILSDGDPNKHWMVEQVFSNKPLPEGKQRCSDTPPGDPLLEPQKVSGSFIKYTEEASMDMDGDPIQTSAGEPVKGKQVEFDKNRPQVMIEQNVANLELGLCASMVDTVNDSTLWGLPTRCIKLSDFSWERKFYGTCYIYYTRKFTFDIMYETFDRVLLDEGTMVLRGVWRTDPNAVDYGAYVIDPFVAAEPHSPSDYIKFKDWNGENASVVLDGAGRPFDSDGSTTGTGDDSPGGLVVRKYSEANFLLLGIPTTF